MTALSDYEGGEWLLTDVPWRVGTSTRRTIYACPPGSSHRRGEVLVGLMDTPELAAEVVEAHNLNVGADAPGVPEP